MLPYILQPPKPDVSTVSPAPVYVGATPPAYVHPPIPEPPTTVVGTKGDKGDKGDRGYSAYEIAVQNGFNGTVTEWLDALPNELIWDSTDW